MGRTIPSYRIASEIEIWKWRPFRKLLDKQDRKKFDEMLSIPRLYNAAGTMAARPILIHVILMSIIFEHYKKLSKIVFNNQKTGGMNKNQPRTTSLIEAGLSYHIVSNKL